VWIAPAKPCSIAQDCIEKKSIISLFLSAITPAGSAPELQEQQEGIMDDTEFKRIADYIEDLESSYGDWYCRKPITHRQLMKLHLTIERLAHTIYQTRDDRLKSMLVVLEGRARRCKRCMESSLTVHS
jgi:hypothetical protein